MRLSASRIAISTLPSLGAHDRLRDADSRAPAPAPRATNSAARVAGACTLKPRMSLKSVRPLLPPKPMSLRKKAEHQRVGQRLGDDREIDAGDAAAEGEPAEHEGEQRPAPAATISTAKGKQSKPYQYQGSSFQFRNTMKSGRIGLRIDAARADLAHQVHAHGVAAEREEGAVAEREDAAVAPDQVERRAPAARSRDTCRAAPPA